MGCNSSKETNGAVDDRYDEHGNLRLASSGSNIGSKLSRSLSMKRSSEGIDVSRVSVHELLKGTKQIRTDSPARLFLLLEKALHQERRPTTPGGGMDLDALDDLTAERQTLYTAAIDQLQASMGKRSNGQSLSPAQYSHPVTQQTPLHLACRLVDIDQNQISAKELCRVMDALLRCYPEALEARDQTGHVPLHYAIAPNHFSSDRRVDRDDEDWRARGIFAQHLFHSNLRAAHTYWQQSDVFFDEDLEIGAQSMGRCSPLYRVLQTLPDDFDRSGPTVDYIKVLLQASYWEENSNSGGSGEIAASNNNNMAGVGNFSDGDKPLGLLYRRFTRQFDISEMFFPGDNSRPEVVQHREKYKYAAGNTWKIIEALLKPPAQHVQDTLALSPSSTSSKLQHQMSQLSSGSPQGTNDNWGIVHRAVQMETPPDLLRYIVETNAQDLTKVDGLGNLPLHYAAMVKPPKPTATSSKQGQRHDTTHFPSFYSKYVVDELLYKFPEAASMTNADGKFPLTLAVSSGKQWIGGGIKSLYDAFPKALGQIDLQQKHHTTLRRALSMGGDNEAPPAGADGDEEDPNATAEDEYKEAAPTSDESLLQLATSMTREENNGDGIIKDEHHDAIMLVQQADVDCREVAIAMWAHEEDAGVQMLGCCAIARLLGESTSETTTLGTALTATAAVVNAMKAHPNEMIVQEKACAALQLLAPSDGQREVSMVASGAVASVVAAMQAHVGDFGVQREACSAIAAIVKNGGGDRATVVASVSGVTAILNALAAHPTSVRVQVEGLRALWQLTDFGASDASMPELPREQTEPLLTQAAEAFPEECGELVAKLADRMKQEEEEADDGELEAKES
ncbi:unnamed protein product [Pseudo-nitzschia multistriata]|uniref:LRRK2 ARM repeat domain-containing protein n=1 Tax=Pseudo-nitzschia multistriata TaxID=183589 RepID=A0A448YY18_9STRA|nr:unnamed protein product [Pseudo-nitzschia multistriata]